MNKSLQSILLLSFAGIVCAAIALPLQMQPLGSEQAFLGGRR